MADIQTLIEEAKRHLEAFEIPTEPKELYDPIRYTLSNGGKRMRPLLVLFGSKIFTDSIEHAIHPAIGIEVFHNFTLLHDDIMDNAPLRRGNKTVHEKWDNNIAILAGDVMMIQAYRELSNTRADVLPEVLAVFNQTAIEVCEGQQFDMNFEQQKDVSISDYLNMIRLKTAVVLGAGLKVGALIGGASADQAKLLYEFGVNTGIAFQLQDDILDAYGNSQKVGKQKGGDIIANKKTFLLLKAKELANADQLTELKHFLALEDKKEKVEGVMQVFEDLNIRSLAELEMKNYYDQALAFLTKVNGSEEWLVELQKFTDKLMHREY